jgi:hypothetical protein
LHILPLDWTSNNECPFIEDNVRQGFVEHFQNLNSELAKIGIMDTLN